jgi:hypothetical protein
MAQNTDPTPMAMESHTCHIGDGVLDAIRSNIVKVFGAGGNLLQRLKSIPDPVILASRESTGLWRRLSGRHQTLRSLHIIDGFTYRHREQPSKKLEEFGKKLHSRTAL